MKKIIKYKDKTLKKLMGACYSSSDSNKIKASIYNRQKKPTTSCLGTICCESNKNYSSIKNPISIINNPSIRSTYNINYKNGPINEYIDSLISNNQSPIPLQKINFIQLYNIFMNYAYDFTKSDFVVCDARKDNEKKQIFLKKFYQINFLPQQVESMQEERMNKFKNYLKNKNIIFILQDETSFEILEQYITIFSVNYDFQLKNIYVLSESINKNEERQINDSYLENLNTFIDEDVLYEYTPKVLINSIDIKSCNLNYQNNLSHNGLIFITSYPHIANTKHNNKNNIHMNKLDINNICDEDLKENNIFLNFFSKFKIECILNFISEEKYENYNNINPGMITHSEAKRKKINGEEHRISIKQKNISLSKNMIDFERYYNSIQNDFDSIIEEFKYQIINNNCIIIEFDDEINNNIKMKLLFIIVNKITGLCFEDIENYLKMNFFILDKSNINIWPNKDEMMNFLK